MHCNLVDFWSKKLGKSRMVARQVSARGGTLTVEIIGDRVKISGKAVLFATFEVDDTILF